MWNFGWEGRSSGCPCSPIQVCSPQTSNEGKSCPLPLGAAHKDVPGVGSIGEISVAISRIPVFGAVCF